MTSYNARKDGVRCSLAFEGDNVIAFPLLEDAEGVSDGDEIATLTRLPQYRFPFPALAGIEKDKYPTELALVAREGEKREREKEMMRALVEEEEVRRANQVQDAVTNSGEQQRNTHTHTTTVTCTHVCLNLNSLKAEVHQIGQSHTLIFEFTENTSLEHHKCDCKQQPTA